MASRRLAEVPVDIPSNANVLHFQRTDGDSSLWPTNTTRIVDHEGQVNYMQHLDLDTPTALKWRLNVARAIAIDKGMSENEEYVLAGWPEGYRLFDHHKGPAQNARHDVYLFGSRKKGRFRSINEFIPHAIWLMRDDSREHESCSCKYCSKKSQKEITASMSNILRSSPTGTSPSPSRPRPTREKKPRQSVPNKPRGRDSRTYAAVQKRPEVAKQAMLVERNSDLRAIFSRTDMKLKRWFREGELVWCALDRSISCPDQSEDVAIRFWPALVDETRLKSQAVNQGVSDPQAYLRTDDGSVQNADGDNEAASYPQEPSWTVLQYYSYKVHLLVTNNTLIVPDDRILPYQALAPSNGLMNAMSSFPPERLDLDRDSLRSFDPCADRQIDFDSAIAPYAMALQIAGALSAYWCLTDEWTATFATPIPPPTRPPPPEISALTSLQEAIAQAHQHNADTSMSNRITVLDPGPQIAQVRYQGLWWGGERIWTDDFIRLKVPRRCLAPMGAENIAPASGPGKVARDVWLQQGRDLSELGASARGIFMRLEALIVVDALQPDGKSRKECRACGMLYELADVDWEEPKADAIEQNSTNSRQTIPANGQSQRITPTSESQQVQSNGEFTPPVIPVTAVGPGQPITPLAPMPDTESKKQSCSKSRYLLPEAPEGYRFRPILPEGREAVLSLSLISGRYYPRLLSHPLLDDTLRKAIARPPEDGGISESNNLWALEGLSAGYYNSVDPTHYKLTRSLMIEEAEKAAREQLEQYKAQFVAGEELVYPMEVDL